MPTRSQLLKLADEAAASAAEHGRLRAMMLEQERQLRAMAASMALTSEHEPNTVDDVTPSSNALRSQAQMADEVREHRFVKALARRGLTFADAAEALEKKLGRKLPRSTVQSWPKPKGDPSYRAIPQDAAEALKALYGVPLSAWPRVIPS